MSHPLTTQVSGSRPSLFPRRLGKQWAGVTVEYRNKALYICEGEIGVLRDDTRVVELPEKLKVMSPDGSEQVAPCHRFWITTESFDPFHVVIDWDGK